MLTKDEVRHIAKLAKLDLSDEQLETYAGQLSQILDFFTELQEVDTDNVEETSQVTGLQNITRPDEIKDCDYKEDLLECSPHEIEDNCIKIPKVL